MASISSGTFTVAEHTPEDSEYRATRRFLVNPECLKPFKLVAGEVVAILNPEHLDAAVSAKCSIYFYCSDLLLTSRTPLQPFSVGILWPNSELEKHRHSSHQTLWHYLIVYISSDFCNAISSHDHWSHTRRRCKDIPAQRQCAAWCTGPTADTRGRSSPRRRKNSREAPCRLQTVNREAARLAHATCEGRVRFVLPNP